MSGCLLEKTETLDGTDYDCGYENAPECDHCMYGPASIYGGVAINPETGEEVFCEGGQHRREDDDQGRDHFQDP